MMKFEREYHITPFDRDPEGRIKWGTLSEKLQECSWLHIEKLGLGLQLLKEHGIFWALTRQMIRVQEEIVPDQIVVETWPRGIDGQYGIRDFRVSDKAGNTLIESTASYLLVDFKTRKTGSWELIPENFKENYTKGLFDFSIPKVPEIEDISYSEMIRGRYYDIDIHRHVNNTRYLTWFGNAFRSQNPKKKIELIVMNFLGELKEGEEVELQCSDNSEQFLFGLTKADRAVFKASVI